MADALNTILSHRYGALRDKYNLAAEDFYGSIRGKVREVGGTVFSASSPERTNDPRYPTHVGGFFTKVVTTPGAASDAVDQQAEMLSRRYNVSWLDTTSWTERNGRSAVQHVVHFL